MQLFKDKQESTRGYRDSSERKRELLEALALAHTLLSSLCWSRAAHHSDTKMEGKLAAITHNGWITQKDASLFFPLLQGYQFFIIKLNLGS